MQATRDLGRDATRRLVDNATLQAHLLDLALHVGTRGTRSKVLMEGLRVVARVTRQGKSMYLLLLFGR